MLGGPLPDPEDDELRGSQRGYADETDQPAVVEVVLGHRRAVALDEEGLLRLRSLQLARAPLGREEVGDGVPDLGPQRLGVRLEHSPLRATSDRSFEVD